MATTTNYGWETPDDTDLVKDGASAIRTLGSSIDTTTKALNPATTLGDLQYRSATANTNTRLAIGTAGQVLTVNSGATAPEWTTISAGGMTLLSTTTLSGTATTISSISQSYKDLLINIYGMTSSSSTQDVWAGMNGYGGFSQAAWGSGTSNTSGTKTSEQQWVTDGSTYFSSGSWFIHIPNYASTANNKIASFNGFYGSQTCISGTFTSNSTSAVSSIYLKCPQTFSAGTVKIWGIN